MNVFQMQGTLMFLVVIVLLVLKGYVFISALMFSGEAYEAAGKLTKTAWAAITGIGFAFALLYPGGMLINLVFTVAALVYLADVRPALREVTSRR
ncbi:MAG: DUF2516 family protein [Nocardioides sp.]|nr:DUF2516 family protein [Nocardioides sp.]